MRGTSVCVVALMLGVGCKGGEKAPPPSAGEPTTNASAVGPTGGADKPAAQPAAVKKTQSITAETVKKEALALLEAWVKAQNDGDQDKYFGMYEPKHFKGVKRTNKGKVSRYDFAGWKTDRGGMFTKKPTVAGEKPDVTTWLDDGAKLKKGVTIIKFTQRWKTAKYADHGIKALHLWRDGDGKQHIIYEDLLNAEPGWDDAPEENVEDLEVPAFKTNDEALAFWHKLAPTGADYAEKLASIPDDTAVTRPLARALLEGGKFACDKKIEYDECGTEYQEWEPLDPKATFDDPCLRRRLAMWAIEDAGLIEADMKELDAELAELVALAEPETELPPAVMILVDDMADSIRVPLIEAAAAAGRRELAEESLTGLAPASLVTLFREQHLDAAVKQLSSDPKQHRLVLLEALVDERLDVATRADLLGVFDDIEGSDVKAALLEVAADDDCGLAMGAAVELAERKDSSQLPRKPGMPDAAAHGRAMCLLMHDPDAARANERWAQFFPTGKGATVTEEVDNDFDYGEEEGSEEEAEEPETVYINRDSASMADFHEAFGEKAPSCSGESCAVDTPDGNFTVTFKVGKDGKMYISNIHTYRWIGCGC